MTGGEPRDDRAAPELGRVRVRLGSALSPSAAPAHARCRRMSASELATIVVVSRRPTSLLVVVFASVALEAAAIDYFGYARTEGVGREVAAWTNVGHFLVEDPIFDYTGQINHWKVVYDMKSIVELSHVFVPGRTGSLYPDWQERWHTFVEVNGRRLTPDFVAAFLVMDEPLLRGLSWAQTAELVATVKGTLPDLATAVVENGELVEQLPSPLPPELDWVGLDAYGIRNPAQDARYLSQLDSLRRRMLPAQRLVVVGDGWFGPVHLATGLEPCDMADVAWGYFELAVERDAVALIFFLWKSDVIREEVDGAVGSDEFDRCDFCARRPINTQRIIGALVTAKQPVFPACARRHLDATR